MSRVFFLGLCPRRFFFLVRQSFYLVGWNFFSSAKSFSPGLRFFLVGQIFFSWVRFFFCGSIFFPVSFFAKGPNFDLFRGLTRNTSHKFWDQFPSPNINVVCRYLRQKLRCCYSSNILQNWVGGRGMIYFCKVEHSRISRNFSRNWLGLNNLCEILRIISLLI